MGKYFERVPRFLSLSGFAVLIWLMIWAVAGVIAQFIGHPIQGIMEFTEILIPVALLLPLVHVQQEKRHIAVDILSRRFSSKVSQIVDIFKLGMQFLLLALLSWQLSLQALYSIQMLEVFAPIDTVIQPYAFPGRVCTAIAFWCAAIVAFRQIVGKCNRRSANTSI